MSETMCAWCQTPARGSALVAKKSGRRTVYRRAPSCAAPGHGSHYQSGFMALNVQVLRTESAAIHYAASMAEQGKPSPYGRFDPAHLEAMDAALLAADAMELEQDPRLPNPRNYLTDPETYNRVKRAAALGARDARAMAEGMGFPYLPERILQHAAEAALGHLMESLDVVKDQPK